ncbi:MAG: hypothetical protein NTX50_15960 [Candidatus Sumerlaeota bacterium]|nr:hypothetical protein [Candidatus Sumerlaeota bacterium]
MAGAQLDQRAKLAGGIIVALALVGALHWFVYQKNQKTFEGIRSRFNILNAKASKLSKGNREELDTYKAVTTEFQKTEKQILDQLNVNLPNYLHLEYGTEPTDAAGLLDFNKKVAVAYEMQKAGLRLELHRLLNKRNGKPTLKFLGVTQYNASIPSQNQDLGWLIPEKLPGNMDKPANLADLLTKLKDIQSYISQLNAGNPGLVKYNEDYFKALMEIGINEWNYKYLKYNWQMGEFVPLYNLLAYEDMILANKAKDYEITRKQLEDLLFLLPSLKFIPEKVEIAYPDDPDQIMVAIKQLDMLNDLISRAGKHDVVSINKVRLLDWATYAGDAINSWELYPQIPKPWAPRDPNTPPVPNPLEPNISLWLDYLQKPKPNWIGVLTTIEMNFSATNTNAMQYLFHLAHCARPYEIHALSFHINEEKRDPLMSISVTVTGYIYLKDISREVMTSPEEVLALQAEENIPTEKPAAHKEAGTPAVPEADRATSGAIAPRVTPDRTTTPSAALPATSATLTPAAPKPAAAGTATAPIAPAGAGTTTAPIVPAGAGTATSQTAPSGAGTTPTTPSATGASRTGR